jgi:6-phosphofructokinase 1
MSESIRNIGIITAGGDCGGLNAVVRGAAKIALANGLGAYIIPNGYAGLYNLAGMERITLLDEERVDLVNSAFAGSEAGHSRVKISKIGDPDKYKRIIAGLKKFDIGGLVISGGDDTGGVLVDLTENGIPCVHAPKTMDLDLQTYSVGGDSAINKIAQIVEEIKTTGRTHNRVMIVEVFGRYAGHTAFRGGIASDADCILIPEIPVNFDEVYSHMKRYYMRRILSSDVRSGTYTIVVAEGIRSSSGGHFSEDGSTDAFGHIKLSGAAKHVRQELERKMRGDAAIREFMENSGMYVEGILDMPEIREVSPGHIIRSGTTAAYDVNFGKEVGGAAVMLLMRGITGVTVYQVVGSEIRYMPTKDAIAERSVDLDLISFYEQMDVCFGRAPQRFEPVFVKNEGAPVERFM